VPVRAQVSHEILTAGSSWVVAAERGPRGGVPMSRRPPLGGVVVGVNDGSSARGALTWAAHAARARGLPLVVCHAYGTDETGASLELACAARNRALRTARYGVEVAESAAPGVTATAWAEEGSPAQVLVDACVDPSMIVVGY